MGIHMHIGSKAVLYCPGMYPEVPGEMPYGEIVIICHSINTLSPSRWAEESYIFAFYL